MAWWSNYYIMNDLPIEMKLEINEYLPIKDKLMYLAADKSLRQSFRFTDEFATTGLKITDKFIKSELMESVTILNIVGTDISKVNHLKKLETLIVCSKNEVSLDKCDSITKIVYNDFLVGSIRFDLYKLKSLKIIESPYNRSAVLADNEVSTHGIVVCKLLILLIAITCLVLIMIVGIAIIVVGYTNAYNSMYKKVVAKYAGNNDTIHLYNYLSCEYRSNEYIGDLVTLYYNAFDVCESVMSLDEIFIPYCVSGSLLICFGIIAIMALFIIFGVLIFRMIINEKTINRCIV